MSQPNSFCTISTYSSHHEYIGLLYSLSLHHPGAKIYCLLDTKTKDLVDNLSLPPNLDLKIRVGLDKYSNLNRGMMEKMNIWSDFQMQKALVLLYALEFEEDTMFLDSDILFLHPLNTIDKTKDIAISPHYIKKKNTDEVGYYNGGCLWTKNKQVPLDWIEFTKTSRYFDQASIEDLAEKYSYQELGEEINFTPWRFFHVPDARKVMNMINIDNGELNYGEKPLVFLHTHFLEKNFQQINQIFIQYLKRLQRHRELLIIDRIMEKKWVIKVPKQPQTGIWHHKNDSFRELVLLYKKHHPDLEIKLTESGHCWLGNHIVLYDRPTLEWYNKELQDSSLILLGNGDIEEEGKLLTQWGLKVKPWIFWPRRPFILEKYLNDNPRKSFPDRGIETIFLGNIENNVQKKYRHSELNWEEVLTEYHCTQGTKHKFTAKEYLEKLSNSRYGLALRGYGSKCHREVELMALGTVPIITPGVTITSYLDPPKENIHYLKVESPLELKEKIERIDERKWEEMSRKGSEWYGKNVESKTGWGNVLGKILYEI